MATNQEKYENVPEACTLKEDLEKLPFGHIEGGINLSEGQKQRIHIARALYHDADIFIFDDSFSAVDAHTGFHQFKVFADHESSLHPIVVPRHWIGNLPRTVYFGTSMPAIFKGLTTDEIMFGFWKGFVCIRGFNRQTGAPRPLYARLHLAASKAKNMKAAAAALAAAVVEEARKQKEEATKQQQQRRSRNQM